MCTPAFSRTYFFWSLFPLTLLNTSYTPSITNYLWISESSKFYHTCILLHVLFQECSSFPFLFNPHSSSNLATFTMFIPHCSSHTAQYTLGLVLLNGLQFGRISCGVSTSHPRLMMYLEIWLKHHFLIPNILNAKGKSSII